MDRWCLMPGECASLHAALRGAERITGTRPKVSVLRREDGFGGFEMFAQVECGAEIHHRELCDPRVVEITIWDTRGI